VFLHFGTTLCPTPPQLPSAAPVGAAFTQIDEDPLFAEISPTAMGYRTAPRGFGSGARRGERRRRFLEGSEIIRAAPEESRGAPIN
jgi:hypothetical protein